MMAESSYCSERKDEKRWIENTIFPENFLFLLCSWLYYHASPALLIRGCVDEGRHYHVLGRGGGCVREMENPTGERERETDGEPDDQTTEHRHTAQHTE